MDGPQGHLLNEVSQRQISYNITYTWNLKYDTKELICETERLADRQNRLCGFQQGGGLGEEWTGNLGLVDATYYMYLQLNHVSVH